MWGSILALLGGVEIAQPDIAGIAFPLIVVAIGVLLLVGSRNRR
jgi:hypothetical protein